MTTDHHISQHLGAANGLPSERLDHMAERRERSRSRSRPSQSAAEATQPSQSAAVAAQPSQSAAVAAQPSQSSAAVAAQPLQSEVAAATQPLQQLQLAAQQGVWTLNDAARLIAVLQQSERQGRMSRTVCRLQGPPPSLTLTVYLPQTGDSVAGAPLEENGESEHGGSDDAEVEPGDDMAEQPDDMFQRLQRLQDYVRYLDRWSWRTWQQLARLRNRMAVLEGVNTNP